ncbi:hypothetical protein AB4559_13610 [Vibrio sp. 10N.222.51.C8]|uniref:hypothetical protein n=2 Tax=Vibrionaceae TaxID=641 RepID=UPI000C81FEFD|nr:MULTISPECIES: hypothetical protein [Vibrio]PML69335.1 hypothetical protein BCT71_01385 [Vibrio sp. 10N.261.51.A7]PTO95347.1 hypothetical protein CWO08_11590 [Vibrio sp. 10N.286.48.B8]
MSDFISRLEKYDATLLYNVELSHVNLCDISIDPDLAEIIAESNPVSALKSKSIASKSTQAMSNLVALQSPIWVYKKRNHYYLVSGLLTHFLLINTINSEQSLTRKTPVILLTKKPQNDIKRLIFLSDLTTQLLKKLFITKEKTVKFFLENWFPNDEAKGSYLTNKEWQVIFPELKTKKELAAILNTSNRDL